MRLLIHPDGSSLFGLLPNPDRTIHMPLVQKIQGLRREANEYGYHHPGLVMGTRDLWHLFRRAAHQGPGASH